MKKTKIEIIPAEIDSAEEQLGLTAEESAVLAENISEFTEFSEIADASSIMDALGRTDSEQSAESRELDEFIASGGNSQVAVIPVVDRQVDPEPNRQPVDVIIGNMHLKNPA